VFQVEEKAKGFEGPEVAERAVEKVPEGISARSYPDKQGPNGEDLCMVRYLVRNVPGTSPTENKSER
jgi:hypothetical protein